MKFTNIPPKWDEQGAEPSAELQERGFVAGYKPPAAYFNYLFNKIIVCLKELQTKLSNTITIEDGGTGGATRRSAFENLVYIGQNPVTNTDDDTVNNWCSIGAGYARFNADGTVIAKPSKFGILRNYVTGNREVYQTWNVIGSSLTYHRSGNADNGWACSWTKIYDESNMPPLAPDEIGRSVAVGCGANGVVGWYPVGVININRAYFTYNLQLSVLGNGSKGDGVLSVFIRVDDTAGVLNPDNTYMEFVGKSNVLDATCFAIDASDRENAILYVYCTKPYTRYHFTVLSEAFGTSDKTENDNNRIVLTRNYVETPVVGTNYIENITQTLTAKFNYVTKGDVVDNLLSTSKELPLSANQGRVIAEAFTAGCNTIVAGITAHGITPASNSPEDIVDGINKIYEAGKVEATFTSVGNLVRGANYATDGQNYNSTYLTKNSSTKYTVKTAFTALFVGFFKISQTTTPSVYLKVNGSNLMTLKGNGTKDVAIRGIAIRKMEVGDTIESAASTSDSNIYNSVTWFGIFRIS